MKRQDRQELIEELQKAVDKLNARFKYLEYTIWVEKGEVQVGKKGHMWFTITDKNQIEGWYDECVVFSRYDE